MRETYTIEVTSYGLKLRTPVSLADGKGWYLLYLEKLREVAKRRRPFGQLVDLRGHKAARPGAQQYIVQAMVDFKELGGQRSCVVFDSPIAAMQTKRLAKESGAYRWERYLDAESVPAFEPVAIAWIVEGVDPDLEPAKDPKPEGAEAGRYGVSRS